MLLDSKARGDLGLPESVAAAYVARGEAALRVLILEASGAIPTREIVRDCSSSLSRRVPHLLWLLVTIQQSSREIAISCWRSSARQVRVVALVAELDRIHESDAETVCALAAARSSSDILTHVRWMELLGREAITRRFFRALRDVVGDLALALPRGPSNAERRELALLTVSRLLFLSFLETKGWLAGDFDFLSNQFARCMASGGSYHKRILHPLFFGTLNTRVSSRAERARAFGKIPFLNGGLFTRSQLEKKWNGATLGDDAIGDIFSRLLTTYRFSAREDSANWSETAVDPEILGKAFEALMSAADRKTSGAFYTPQRLVEHVTESALVAAFAKQVDGEVLRALLRGGVLPGPTDREKLLACAGELRLLDPACGTGAFLVHALEKLTEIRIRLGEIGSASDVRRRALTSSIFGVDINPMAVWLCQLRLWLAIVIDSADPDPMHVHPLPNLDRQIRIGDSLRGGSFAPEACPGKGRRLAALRARYIRSVGARKKILARRLDREERREALSDAAALRARLRFQRRDLIIASRSRDLFGARAVSTRTHVDLRSLRTAERAAAAREQKLKAGAALPFSFTIHFADVGARGGFDVVVGNPPWVRIHNISAATRAELQREFLSFSRGAWREGAELAGSGRAFASQIDLAALFIERSIFLTRPNGALALLVPAKLWRSLSGGGVRGAIAKNLEITALEDMTESHTGFDAAVYPSLIVARRTAPRTLAADTSFAAAVHHGATVLQWEQRQSDLPLRDSDGSPWLLVPEEVRAAFEKMSTAGTPLATSSIGRPMLGVKTGCNSAFIVHADDTSIEPRLLRPVLRGETLTSWSFSPNGERIIWTHDARGAPLTTLNASARAHLSKWQATLERRTDNHGSPRWWSLFRIEGASPKSWRVVWCDFGKHPRAAVLPLGSDVVPLNTCYVARCPSERDAFALAALLNGPLLAAWLDAVAEPARGGYRRYLGWTMALMPLPRDWDRAVRVLAPIGARGCRGNPPNSGELLAASLNAFHLRRSDMEALISWTIRT